MVNVQIKINLFSIYNKTNQLLKFMLILKKYVSFVNML